MNPNLEMRANKLVIVIYGNYGTTLPYESEVNKTQNGMMASYPTGNNSNSLVSKIHGILGITSMSGEGNEDYGYADDDYGDDTPTRDEPPRSPREYQRGPGAPFRRPGERPPFLPGTATGQRPSYLPGTGRGQKPSYLP